MSTWILLRGLTRESRHWGDFRARLEGHFPGDEIAAPDLPGNGSLNRVASPKNVAAMTEHCRGRLREQKLAPPYRLVAMSLGAMVAIDWAARYPHEIERAVLINTSVGGLSPAHRRLRLASLRRLAAQMLLRRGAANWERTILGLTTRHAPDPEAVLREWLGYRATHPVSPRNALAQLLAAARFRAPATRPAVPIIVLASRGDQLVDPRCSQALADQWQCDIAWHPSAGHDLPLDDGAWVAKTIQRWLDGAV